MMLCASLCGHLTKILEIGLPGLGYWKSENRFPYLKAAALEFLGMIATSTPSERVFGHTGQLYSKKHANLGVRIFAILMLMRMNPHLGMD